LRRERSREEVKRRGGGEEGRKGKKTSPSLASSPLAHEYRKQKMKINKLN
jgi:hypothetical protein